MDQEKPKNQKIRLPDQVVAAIRKVFLNHFLQSDQLWLFGSRVDPNKKGGDIDLYIETNLTDYGDACNKKIAFLVELTKEIGEQKIDVVLHLMTSSYSLPIYQVARSEGIRLI